MKYRAQNFAYLFLLLAEQVEGRPLQYGHRGAASRRSRGASLPCLSVCLYVRPSVCLSCVVSLGVFMCVCVCFDDIFDALGRRLA